MLSGIDQFIAHIFLLQGQLHQVLRDIGLMIPDLLHVALPIIEYYKEDNAGQFVGFSNGKANNSLKKNPITLNLLIKYCIFVATLLLIGNATFFD